MYKNFDVFTRSFATDMLNNTQGECENRLTSNVERRFHNLCSTSKKDLAMLTFFGKVLNKTSVLLIESDITFIKLKKILILIWIWCEIGWNRPTLRWNFEEKWVLILKQGFWLAKLNKNRMKYSKYHYKFV